MAMPRNVLLRTLIPSAWVLFAGTLAWGQDNPRADEVRQANGNLLQLLADMEGSPASQHVRSRAQGAPLFAARAAALEELIRQDPAQALELAFSPETLRRLRRAFPGSAGSMETHGAWSGEVDYLIFDDLDLSTSESRVRIRTPRGMLDVFFAGGEPEDLKSGVQLQVSGLAVNNTVAALGASVGGTATAAASSCTPIGPQRVAVLLVTFPGVAAPAITPQSVASRLFGATGRSLNNYWQEVSYGLTSATGDVFGWFTLDKLYTCDLYYGMLSAAIAAADPYVNFQNYTRVFVIFANPGGCSWAGLSNVGCRSYSSAGDGTFTASASWMLATYFSTTDYAVKISSHEAGHALGLLHSRSRDFGTVVLGPTGTAGTLNEYGDTFSSMGYWSLGHYTAEQKIALGWMPATNVKTVQSPTTLSVLPTESPASGTQAVRIQRGTDNSWLWVEYRQPIGNYDNSLNWQVFGGALIHYSDGTSGGKTDLLDFTPATSTFSDPALAAGTTWTDPYTNLSLTVTGATAGALNLAVNYGALPCVRAAPTVSLSPANPSVAPGASVSYTLTVTNKDSSGCSGSSFSLSSSLPSGFGSSLSPSVLSLSPGQSGAAILTKTVPAGTTPATYAVNASATGPASSGSASANLTVVPPQASLSVSVSSSATVYTATDLGVFTATVLSGGSPVSGASVLFSLKAPNGSTTTRTVVTDAAGKAVWTYRFSLWASKGLYSLTARATFGSQSASSNTVTFELR